MNVQVKEIIGGGYIKRKFVMAVAIFALILQPLTMVTTAGAVANGPFNTDTVCEAGKAVLKLQAKQEVANWLTGWVTYNTPYGQITHSLPKSDTDVWTVSTNQVELPAGVTSARITGGYIQWVFFVPVTRVYDQTFSINYAALNCDAEKPTIVVDTPDGVINPTTISATATDNYRLEQVTAHMYDGTDNVLKKNCSQNVAALNVTNYEIVCPTTGLADGVYRIKANAKDTFGNISVTLFSTKFIIDSTAPVISGIADGETYKGNVSFTATDTNFDKILVNGSEVIIEEVTTGTYKPQTDLSGNGTYIITAIDKAGHQTELTITIDNSIAVTVDPIENTTATPVISGVAKWVADDTLVDAAPVEVEINGKKFTTTTNSAGEWSVTISPALKNATYPYTVTIGTGEASGSATGSVTINIPVVQSPATPVVVSELITNTPTPFFVPTQSNNGRNLSGSTNTTPAAARQDTSSILGAETTDSDDKKGEVAGTSTEKSSLWEFWWLIALIVAAVAAFIWWLRRRRAEQEA